MRREFGRRRSDAPKRKFAREHFIKHDPEAEDVRVMIDGGGLLDLLRRHVSRRAELQSALRHASRALLLARDFRDAKVGELWRARGVEQDVLGLAVAVQDAVVVGKLQRFANARHEQQRLLRRHARAHRLPQIHAIHVFHEQVVESGAFAEIEHRHDVRDDSAVQVLEPRA